GVATLAAAIDTDIAWIRQHTRIGELARRWESAGRPAMGGRLLRGEELVDAETWLLTSPKSSPDPTEEQRAYVQASRAYENAEIERERAQLARTRRFQKRSAWALAAIGALVIVGLVAAAVQSRRVAQREAIVLTSLANRASEDGYHDRAVRI